MGRHHISFPMGPFEKYSDNPILAPQGDGWESKDLFNPAAIVRDEQIYLFYRAEDRTGDGEWNGTSRIGLAVSDDGFHFRRHPEPVLVPTEPYEIPGGCEDPRIVEIEGTYYLTYTAFDGVTARLCLATSTDLFQWEKHGVIIDEWNFGPRPNWTKSGAIIPERINGQLVMYFGDTDIWIATSEDGIHWQADREPVMKRNTVADSFDSALIEPGPTPIVTSHGILLLYNGARTIAAGEHSGKLFYSVGQVLFAKDEPRRILHRTTQPVFAPETILEQQGQVDFVVFAEGLVHFMDTWLLYYGMADSKIGVASLKLDSRMTID